MQTGGEQVLLGLVRILGIAYYWTWFFWPFVLIFAFAFGITDIIRDRSGGVKNLLLAAAALIMILCGLMAPALS